MAIASNNVLSWSDITAIYTTLNAQRSRASLSQVSVPANPIIAKPDVITSLITFTEDMKANGQVGAIAETGATPPSSGTIIYPTEFVKIQDTLSRISSTTINGANFGFNGSNFSGFCNFGFDGTNFSSFHSGNFSGHHSSNFSGFNGSNFSGHHTSNVTFSANPSHSYNPTECSCVTFA